MTGRKRRDPNIHWTPAHPQGDSTVLRQALFGDIELGHDLDPTDQRGMQRALGPHHIAQSAIDAEPHQ